ncbi:MAG: hypothetical protein KY461_04380 [Actinobacteria bacterium]|nr:hypothetical protein [Actinomycetota bacterium]
MHPVRALAGVVLVAVAVACAPTAPPDDRGAGETAPSGGAAGTPTTGAATTPPGDDPGDGGASPADRPQGDALTDGESGADAGLTPVDDLAGVGANGRAMLRGDRGRLVVEVDVQEGLEPSQEAIDHLLATLRQQVDKPGGVELAGGNTFSSDRTQWTAADLRDVGAAQRSTSSGDDVVSLYVLYVRGGFVSDGEETRAIGVAHRASELAVFPDRWSGLGDLIGSDRRIERAVLVHELGHLFGLVELTYDSDHDRQDPDHPGHSSDRSSVMHYAVETTLVGQVFNGPPPDTFTAADRDDLAALREGR